MEDRSGKEEPPLAMHPSVPISFTFQTVLSYFILGVCGVGHPLVFNSTDIKDNFTSFCHFRYVQYNILRSHTH